MVANRERDYRNAVQGRQVFYGQLQCIIDVVLPSSDILNITQPQRFLLALIEPCSTQGRDATRELTTYMATTAQIVIDLRTIEWCVVGRGNEWGIVDRSGDFARTVFVDPEVEED